MTMMEIQIAVFQAIVDHNNKQLQLLVDNKVTLQEYQRMSFPVGSTRIIEEAIKNAYKEAQDAR